MLLGVSLQAALLSLAVELIIFREAVDSFPLPPAAWSQQLQGVRSPALLWGDLLALKRSQIVRPRGDVSLSALVDDTKDSSDGQQSPLLPPAHHVVHGVVCMEVPMEFPSLGTVTVLEATAEAQERLVNMALGEGAEGDSTDNARLNAGDPYGAVLWPAAYSVAERILTDPSYNHELHNMTILELGAGTGLVSLAVALAGAKKVVATDYEDIPLQLLKHAASHLNGATMSMEFQLLDMRDYANPLPQADLVVAADIMYEPKTGKAMARRAVEALTKGSRVLVGDSPGRPGRAAFLQELQDLGVVDAIFVDTVGFTCSGPRHDLICGKNSTSVSETPQELLVAVMELLPQRNLRQQ